MQLTTHLKEIAIAFGVVGLIIATHPANAADRIDNAKEAVQQSAKSAESKMKSKTSDSTVERFVEDKKATYHKRKAKSAAKKAVE